MEKENVRIQSKSCALLLQPTNFSANDQSNHVEVFSVLYLTIPSGIIYQSLAINRWFPGVSDQPLGSRQFHSNCQQPQATTYNQPHFYMATGGCESVANQSLGLCDHLNFVLAVSLGALDFGRCDNTGNHLL